MTTTTWSCAPRRSDVLRTVLDTIEERQDGRLPDDVPGVPETVGDDLALVGALALRWHTRLSGAIERALDEQPFDAAAAVVDAWADSASAAPGLRRLLDVRRESPGSAGEADALATAARKERAMLAAMAGMESPSDPHAARTGAALELLARGQLTPTPTAAPSRATPAGRATPADPEQPASPGHRLVGRISRIKAALAA